MNIDIEINFNDLIPPQGLSMEPENKPPYYAQLIYLIKSIELNWDKKVYDYSIYVHYSRDLAETKRQELKSLSCKLVYNPSEIQPYVNRENVFGHKTHGDYTLNLDTDMLVLNTPSLEFDREVYMKPAEALIITNDKWETASEKLGVKHSPRSHYHFNGGCMLIKNNCKKILYDWYVDPENLKVLRLLESYDRHYSGQFYYSILIRKLNWGILNQRVNAYSTSFKAYSLDMPVDILHYLGIYGYDKKVEDLIEKIMKCYKT